MLCCLQHVAPRHFNRACAAAALLYLAGAIGASLALRPNLQDFPQYYMGGVIARAGAWEALYPDPIPGASRNAGEPEGSRMRPRYAELAEAHGIGDGANRFIQPPPLALLYSPLAYLSVRQAYMLWMALLVLAGWWTAALAGQLFESLRGRPSRWSGLVTLLVAFSPLMYRSIRTAQVSTFIAACIGITMLAMLRRRPFGTALGIFLAALAKYAAGILALLLAILGRWRSLAWVVSFTLLAALTIPLTGWQPYRVYVREIMPTLERVFDWRGNQSLSGFLARVLRQTGDLPTGVTLTIRAVGVVLLIALVAFIWRRRRSLAVSPPLLLAAAAALLAWWPLISPIYWEHYYLYLAPLWGWLVWEALQSRMRAVVAIAALAMLWVPWAVLPRWALPEPLTSHMLWGNLLVLGLAVRRLAGDE